MIIVPLMDEIIEEIKKSNGPRRRAMILALLSLMDSEEPDGMGIGA